MVGTDRQRPRRLVLAIVLILAMVTAACGARFDDDTPVAASRGATGDTTQLDAGTPVDGAVTVDPITGETIPAAGGPTPAAGAGNRAATATTRAGSSSASAVAAGAVEPGPSTGVTATRIKIGYLLPLTGAAPVPSNFDKGANVYWRYVNDRNGINGRKVDIIIKDTQSSASVGKQEAQKLIEDDKVFAIVVLDRLENQKAIGAFLDARKVPNIQIQTPANLDASQTWTFGVTIDHAVQGALIADYLIKSHPKASKLAIVYENTSELHPGRDAFTKRVQALGKQVTYSKAIEGQENNFSDVALELSNSGATATWLYMAPTPAAKLANQADSAGYHPTWFANSISWGFDLVFTVGPKALAGARAFSPWLPLTDPRTKTFRDAYQSQTGETPDDLGIVGWGVGEIVGEAIRRTPNPLGQNNFRHSFQNLDFKPQVWAPVKFGAGVRNGAANVAVLKESGGRWALDRDFSSSF
ncbi:MAG TPA: ABC transporter substrate-binding protein [Acidimicrobiales bacterium]|nr:ABC transporter substrate-binding protein [Acidimicrobiales bacterium]